MLSQAFDRRHREFVENQLWTDSGVVLSALHVVGSDNGLAPWFGASETPAQRDERLDEFDRRTRANLDWLDATFAHARRTRAPGVVVAMQADTFTGGTTPGFVAIVQRLEGLARRFGRPVLLLQSDTHDYLTDRPLASAPNLVRVVVEGETASEWLRLTVDPRSAAVFSWERRTLP